MAKAHDTPVKSEKPTQQKNETLVKNNGPTILPGNCFSWGCKQSATRFNFCEEHFDHFKFGLIKKTGEPALDYDKKIEHFKAYATKRRAHQNAQK